MIISSLCDYYNIMMRRGDVLPKGYSDIEIKYLVSLTKEGIIDDIMYLGREEGKKKIFPHMLLPLRTQKPGIDANIIEHRPLYIFGLVYENGVFRADDSRAKKSHAAFVKQNLEFTEGLSSPLVQAYRNFILHWDPERECDNKFLANIAKDYTNGKFAFCLSGRPDKYLQDEPEVKTKWEEHFAANKDSEDANFAICPVLGRELPVARLHKNINGIRNGQPSGCKLVCFNNSSEYSYGKEQSFNSLISEEAMEMYIEALNFLLADERHRTYLGNMTIVHFALAEEETPYVDDVNAFLLANTDETKPDDVDQSVSNSMKKVAVGQKTTFDVPDAGVNYCIFGLVPNSSRIAIKFSYRNTFGELRKNIERYHADFAVGKRDGAPPVWAICKELVSPNAKDTAPPDLEEEILYPAINGSPLPQKVLETVVRRVRTDSDTDTQHFIKINDTRAGLIKVCLNRKTNKEEEKITMALNVQNKNTAYLCGRLFAVLEKIQQNSLSEEPNKDKDDRHKLNKTIKDSYFSSACATPAVVFAKLIRLSQNHLSKLRKFKLGSITLEDYYNKLIGEIVGDLDEFPKTLSLEEQGKFILGYYQQNTALYTKKENNTEEN